MSYYSDPTANAAIGAVDKEIKQMKKRAKLIKKLRSGGKLTPAQLEKLELEFTGIFAHLLDENFVEDEQ